MHNKKLKTQHGYLIRYRYPATGKTLFFFVYPDLGYKVWKHTRKTGELPTKDEYLRLKAEGLEENNLTANEIFHAGRIAAMLSKNPLSGISKEEAAGIVRKKIRQTDRLKEKKFSEATKGKLFKKFREDLGINENFTDEERLKGPGVVVVGQFTSATAEVRVANR